jgi:hypothetical protein
MGDRQRERRVGARPWRDPGAAEIGRAVVEVRVDMNDFDAEPLQPLAPDRALLAGIDAAGRFRIARPEDHHLGVGEQILDSAVALAEAHPHGVAPMVRGAPVPALPAVGVARDRGMADEVREALQRAEIIADIAPAVVRLALESDGARPVRELLALDFIGDDGERLVPRDRHIAGEAAILRIALAGRVEIDALQGMQHAVRRIDRRFPVERVRRDRRLARRREALPARLDGPGGAVRLLEIDGRDADDLAVLHIDEDRPAIGHVAGAQGAVGQPHARLPAHRLDHHQGLGEPGAEILRPVDAELEVLLRVDLLEPVDRRGQ